MDEAIWIAFAFALSLAVHLVGLPPLVGFLAAGFALHAFAIEGQEILSHVAHLGVLVLLFSIGLKIQLKYILHPVVWATTLIHLALVSAFVMAVLVSTTSLPSQGTLIIALGLSFSSTVIAAKVLESRRELRAFHGRIAIGILIFQDIVAVAMLNTMGGHLPSPYALLLLGLPLLRPVLNKLLELSGHDELLILFGLLLALTGGTAFEAIGLSSELGALVLGAMLANHSKADELANTLWGLKETLWQRLYPTTELGGRVGT